MLASFGLVGLFVLTALVSWTVLRLRKAPELRLFLPFVIASLINSAGGWESYKFVVVAIVVAGLVRPLRDARRLRTEHPYRTFPRDWPPVTGSATQYRSGHDPWARERRRCPTHGRLSTLTGRAGLDAVS